MLKILELFGGIGAFRKSLINIGIPFETVDFVEIDKYAVKSYNAIYNTNFEPQDITTWDKDIECDLIMHGSPCQDFSLAGKQAGGDLGSGTRSSLLYETVRIVSKLKPKYVIWENVKNVLSQKHRHNFDNYLSEMEQLGYTNYYQVLNAKDYGIPQNRERVFTVSILKEKIIYDDYNSSVRKDQDTIGTLTCNCGSSAIRNGWKIIECEQNFTFPPKQELKLRLKDMLEEEVDDKYYLSEKMANYVLDMNDKQKGTKWEGRADNDILNPIIGHTLSVHSAGGCQRAGVSNFIVDNYDGELSVKTAKTICINSKGGRGGVDGLQPSLQYRICDSKGILTSITTSYLPSVLDNLKIRKLTPKECWRLMGFSDDDFEKAARVCSDSQLYKQAGNSIVVNVLEQIFMSLFYGI